MDATTHILEALHAIGTAVACNNPARWDQSPDLRTIVAAAIASELPTRKRVRALDHDALVALVTEHAERVTEAVARAQSVRLTTTAHTDAVPNSYRGKAEADAAWITTLVRDGRVIRTSWQATRGYARRVAYGAPAEITTTEELHGPRMDRGFKTAKGAERLAAQIRAQLSPLIIVRIVGARGHYLVETEQPSLRSDAHGPLLRWYGVSGRPAGTMPEGNL